MKIFQIYFIYIHLIFIFLLKIENIKLINPSRNLINKYSEIHLIIQGNGLQNLLSDSDYNEADDPSEVYVEAVLKEGCIKTCNLEKDRNKITLRYSNKMKTCYYMFYCLTNLIEVDLSDFDASEVSKMNGMFYGCSSLEKITFGNIKTDSLENIAGAFTKCHKLKSIDLSNFDFSKVTNINNLFMDSIKLETINFGNITTSMVESMDSVFNNCLKLISVDLSKFDTTNVKSMNRMFSNCTSLKYLDLSSFNTSKVTRIDYMFNLCQSLLFLNLKSFILSSTVSATDVVKYISTNVKYCVTDIITKSKLSIDSDKNDCSDSCFKENNKCIEDLCLNTDYKYIYNNKCYIFCPNNTYELNYEENDNCENYNNKIPCYDKAPKGYCLDEVNKIYKKCFSSCISCNTQELIKNMINNIFYQLNITNIDSGIDKKLIEKNISIILTSTKNQKKNNNEKIITMDLGQCENILKDEYNISNENPLYILQVIAEEEGIKIPKIEYEVYYPSYDSNNDLEKLNLTLCKGTKIEISIPVEISDNIDKYNPKSDYYNDICYKTTSESGTDLSLKDRRNEFSENNMTLCEENCILIGYNNSNEKVKCSCEIKTNVSPNYDLKFNTKDFYKSFIDIKNIANINIIKCYKTVLNIKNLINNYGFYIITPIMVLYFVISIIFWLVSYKNLRKMLFGVVEVVNKDKQIEVYPIINEKGNPLKKKIKRNKKIKVMKKQSGSDVDNDIINKNSNLRNINLQITYKDFEINSLEYDEAFKLDKRNYLQYYFSLLKYNHPLIFSFGAYNDYNSRIIKIFLFFFSFSSDFTINALFFNDNTMHKIYEDKGKYNLLFQIPQILYSTLISRIIDIFIKNLALSQNYIIELKHEKGKNNISKKYIRILKILKIKSILFFIFAFGILSIFWYYITCFCGIYTNTQFHLIKDSIISLIISFIYPLGLYLIPGLFRIPSLRMKIPSGKLLYRFSSFLEYFLV